MIALEIRFWNTAVSRPASPVTVGSPLATTSPPVSRSAVASRAWACATSSPVSTGSCGPVPRPTRENVEQVVDQLLHPLGAVDGELDVAIGPLVELAAVAALEHLREARDLAQRLLQVVRRDVGELLELLVGALELARLLDQRALGVAQRRDLCDDPLAHRLDVRAQRRDLARPGGLHPPLEVAARDRADLRAEARERPDDDAAAR